MKHYQTVDPLQKESQVGRGLFGIRVLILHFKFQFSKSVKSSTFHIFLNLTYPLRKNLSFPKHLKITQKFTQNCQIVDNVLSIGIWRRLKRDRDIGRKAVLSDVKTAFTFTPALTQNVYHNSTLLTTRHYSGHQVLPISDVKPFLINGLNQTLDLPQVDLMNLRVEYVRPRSGRASDEVARGRLVSLERFHLRFAPKNEEWRDLQLVSKITFGSP